MLDIRKEASKLHYWKQNKDREKTSFEINEKKHYQYI